MPWLNARWFNRSQCMCNPVVDASLLLWGEVAAVLVEVIRTSDNVEPTVSLEFCDEAVVHITQDVSDAEVGFHSVKAPYVDAVCHGVGVLSVKVGSVAECHLA